MINSEAETVVVQNRYVSIIEYDHFAIFDITIKNIHEILLVFFIQCFSFRVN